MAKTKITESAAHARLGVALEALGNEPGETALADSALRGARHVLLAFQMALLSREAEPIDPPQGPIRD